MSFEIVLATNNKHKLVEVRKILSPYDITVFGLSDLNLKPEEVEENAPTYAGNALIKARSVAQLTNLPVISDDSGIEVESFNNRPGIKTARYATSMGGHEPAMLSLIEMCDKTGNRNAKFVCDIALVQKDKAEKVFEGITNGLIANRISGVGGFGYDPIFVVDGCNGKTYAEISEEEKNKVSHRARALLKLVDYLLSNDLIGTR